MQAAFHPARRSRAVRLGLLSRISIAAAALALAPVAAWSQTPGPARDTSKIVVVGGAITEIVYRLGAADRIVALDSTSLYPPEALKSKPSVGYMRALSTEGVLATAPTLVIASDRSGPPEVMRAIKAAVPVVEIDETPTLEALLARVSVLARLLGREQEGAALKVEIAGGFAALAKLRASRTGATRAIFVLNVSNGRIIVAGRETVAHAVMELAGASNAAAAVSGYKPFTEEGIIELAPDVVLTISTGPGQRNLEALSAHRGILATPAGRLGRLHAIDALLVLGFGPRTPEAALAIGRLIAAPAATR
jgi:iron complex transport system substrate-binding protein